MGKRIIFDILISFLSAGIANVGGIYFAIGMNNLKIYPITFIYFLSGMMAMSIGTLVYSGIHKDAEELRQRGEGK